MYNILEFGAVCDKNINSTKAFQSAIDECKEAGGGIVYIPYGEYTLGTVHLCSDLHLIFEPGAKIYGSLDVDDFDEREAVNYPLFQDASHSYFNRSMFVAKNCDNITLSGYGTIDMREVWEKEPIKGEAEWGSRRAAKIFTFKECNDIVISDLTLLHSTDLALYLVGCKRAKVRNMTFEVNMDAISPDCCENVIISDCIIKSGDDGIVIKSSYALNKKIQSENIVVTNCTVSSRASAIKLGTESNGGYKNIAISNCTIHDTCLGGVSLEITDGGDLDGITVSNITMDNVSYPFFVILSDRRRGPEGTQMGTLKNIVINNITAVGPYHKWKAPIMTHLQDPDSLAECFIRPSTFTGQPDRKIENISLSNIFITVPGGEGEENKTVILPEITHDYPEAYQFGNEFPTYGMFFRHVKNLTLNNVRIDTIAPDGRNPFVFDDVENFKIF